MLGRWSVLGLILLDLLDWYLNDHCWIDIGYSFNDIDAYFEDHPTNCNW